MTAYSHKNVFVYIAIMTLVLFAMGTSCQQTATQEPPKTTTWEQMSVKDLMRYNYHFSFINLHCSKSTTQPGYDFCHYAIEIEYLLNAFTTEMTNKKQLNVLIFESLYRTANYYLEREFLLEKRMKLLMKALNITD
jgi:hypothetical protein